MYKYPYRDNVQWPWPGSIPQRSRSHWTIKVQSTHARVRVITYLCIDGIPYNLVQMFSYLRHCAVTLTGYRLQSSRSCNTFKGQSIHVCVRAITLFIHWSFGGGYNRPLDCLVWFKFVASCLRCCLCFIILYQWSCFAINRFGIFTLSLKKSNH